MISERQTAAAPANGAESRGPVTAQGKARSSGNSLRHGLRAQILLEDETSEAERTEILASYMNDLQPQSELECRLVKIMAFSHWFKTRIWRLETKLLNDEMCRQESQTSDEDWNTRLALAFRALCDQSSSLELLGRFEARFARRFFGALDQFLEIRAQKNVEATPPSPAHITKRSQFPEPRRSAQLVENK